MSRFNVTVGVATLCAMVLAVGCEWARGSESQEMDRCGSRLVAKSQTCSMTIAEDGVAMATIVTSSDSEETLRAVKDLQRYIEKMSGAKLPIINSAPLEGNLILVGRLPEVDKLVPDLEQYDLGPDGFIIRQLPDKLILSGKSDGFIHPSLGRFRGPTDCGTPNAVYSFLGSLGCRWYMPGEDGEVVPHKPTLTISDADITSKPAFDARWIGIWTREGKSFEDFRLWRARNRISHNTYFHMHTLSPALFPDAASHPEYFALVDGQRKVGSTSAVCFSNLDVIDILSKNIIDIITKQPPFWRSYTVGQADGGSDSWCKCDNCIALYGDKKFTYSTSEQARVVGRSPSDQRVDNVANGYLTMVNAIAERAEKVNPDVLLTYYSLYNLPGRPTVKPRDSVLPVICHLAPDNDFWRREVLHWADISRHLYYYTYMGYRLDFPRLDIADDIRWCHQHKGIAMYLEHDSFTPINMVAMYLAAQALWDTNVDSDQALTEFYVNYFGASEAPMRQFFETFHRLTRGTHQGYDAAYKYPETLNVEMAATCRGYIDQAQRRARQPVVRRRIDSISRYWRATELHVAAQDAIARWKQEKTVENMHATRSAYATAIDYIDSVAEEFSLQARIPLLNHEGYNSDLQELNAWDKARKQP